MANRSIVHRIHGGYVRSRENKNARRLILEADGEIGLPDVVGEDDVGGDDFCPVDTSLETGDPSDTLAGLGDDCPFGYRRGPEVLIEDTWKMGDHIDPSDRGIGYLRYVMGSVKPSEIPFKDIKWVVTKYILLSAIVQGGLLSRELFDRSDENSIFVRYVMALQDRLGAAGIQFAVYRGLTREGWDTYARLTGFVMPA